MIDYITGTLQVKQPHRVVVDYRGMGVEILVPFSTSKDLPEKGLQVKLLCHLNWRQEDGPQLFGFSCENERQIFRILTGVNKVGPKMALNIMSATTPEALATMILSENIAGLQSLKGVGPKLASRLIVELKDQIVKMGIGNVDGARPEQSENHIIPFEDDVREALENLGYSAKEITACLKRVAKELPADSSIEDTIGAVLRAFAG
ncbi:Holliday junction branch migration protein RuvA [bacterium]|nr:Holliday junction branch migration protein RuvA [bacterium]